MDNYGCYTENEAGVKQWVTAQTPLTLGAEQDAINDWSYADACSVSLYLTGSEGATFAPGRPVRKPNS